jgi:hypothetical protein
VDRGTPAAFYLHDRGVGREGGEENFIRPPWSTNAMGILTQPHYCCSPTPVFCMGPMVGDLFFSRGGSEAASRFGQINTSVDNAYTPGIPRSF